MPDWVLEHPALVSSLISSATLLVWLPYLALFYREYKHQRTHFIVIHQAKGHDLEATCLVVNLSREPIHVLCILMVLHTGRGVFSQRIRNFRRPRAPEVHPDVQTILKQGPLASGGFLVLGSFEEMLESAIEDVLAHSPEWGMPEEPPTPAELVRELDRIEVRVIALHGARGHPVGAYRSFDIHQEEDRVGIGPAMLLTRQMGSRSEVRTVEEWLRECIPYPIAD